MVSLINNGVSVDLVRHYAVDQYIPNHFVFHLFRVPSLLDQLFCFGDKFICCHFPLFEVSSVENLVILEFAIYLLLFKDRVDP